jgi:hypothetical protein
LQKQRHIVSLEKGKAQNKKEIKIPCTMQSLNLDYISAIKEQPRIIQTSVF